MVIAEMCLNISLQLYCISHSAPYGSRMGRSHQVGVALVGTRRPLQPRWLPSSVQVVTREAAAAVEDGPSVLSQVNSNSSNRAEMNSVDARPRQGSRVEGAITTKHGGTGYQSSWQQADSISFSPRTDDHCSDDQVFLTRRSVLVQAEDFVSHWP